MSSRTARSAAKTLAAVTLGASTSEAAIVVFDFNPDVLTRSASSMGSYDSSTLNINNINLGAGTFTSSLINGNVYNSYFSVYSNQFTFGAWSYNSPRQVALSSPAANTNVLDGSNNEFAPLAAGQVIGSTGNWSYGSTSVSNLASGTSYFGLRIGNGSGGFNYGWIEVTHGPAGDLWTRFAFETVLNQSILTGQTSAVPEASTLGFVGGLFGLAAAAHLRRRKLKQAAASDKFLALAAGEKLN